MKPRLHKWYATDAAVASFGGKKCQFLCDGQFVVLPKVILCLATVGDGSRAARLRSPSCLEWRPRRHNYEPSGEFRWLPKKVREVWGRDGTKIREHHAFIRANKDDLFCYAGEAHLGSYGGMVAEFLLKRKLPRDVWLRFGGYPGWLVEVNHRTHRVENGDNPAFERIIAKLSKTRFSHLTMTRYEEDSLTLHTNAQRGWLMYLRHPDDTGLYARDLKHRGDAEETFECTCGIDLEFPPTQTLKRALAIQSVIEFFRSGKIPRRIHWEFE